jgi:hypothetical protein
MEAFAYFTQIRLTQSGHVKWRLLYWKWVFTSKHHQLIQHTLRSRQNAALGKDVDAKAMLYFFRLL